MQTYPIQLFDTTSSTYTYILADRKSAEAVIIDPVDTLAERDLQQLEHLGLKLVLILETHAHADHITSAGKLRQLTDANAAVPSGCGIQFADRLLEDGDVLRFGEAEEIRVIHTPGHTPGSVSYWWRDNLFSGDALLINGCGRTDFQGGSAHDLYHSVVHKLFTLPDHTLVWPAHDYKGQSVSCISWERAHNARLAQQSEENFVNIMENLKLPRPAMIDVAVPANRMLGLTHAA